MQILGGENSVELLRIFSHEVEREITTTSEFAAEEEAENKECHCSSSFGESTCAWICVHRIQT